MSHYLPNSNLNEGDGDKTRRLTVALQIKAYVRFRESFFQSTMSDIRRKAAARSGSSPSRDANQSQKRPEQ
jgi:hypothetical protein